MFVLEKMKPWKICMVRIYWCGDFPLTVNAGIAPECEKKEPEFLQAPVLLYIDSGVERTIATNGEDLTKINGVIIVLCVNTFDRGVKELLWTENI